ncbi:dna-mediated transposase [Lasius niger]|uniref:Dna-mediated transposase n=1 Tax=Lasius niger TaxID=67767 RepID=A0A0J7KKI0_LASNI|nr:dna-mediated transposase [Lasius niger]
MLNNLHLVSKWGCDGSSGRSLYKQVFTAFQQSDSDLFMTCLVPLQLYALSENDGKRIFLWQNPRPSSTRYCRVVKLEFIKETAEVIRMEKAKMEKQMKELLPSEVEIPDLPHVTVHHDLCMTMIDGKTCNALTNTNSAQKCNTCGATPANMNDIDEVEKN